MLNYLEEKNNAYLAQNEVSARSTSMPIIFKIWFYEELLHLHQQINIGWKLRRNIFLSVTQPLIARRSVERSRR